MLFSISTRDCYYSHFEFQGDFPENLKLLQKSRSKLNPSKVLTYDTSYTQYSYK